jgi:hypothetical protein
MTSCSETEQLLRSTITQPKFGILRFCSYDDKQQRMRAYSSESVTTGFKEPPEGEDADVACQPAE